MTLTLAYILTQYRNALPYHLYNHAKCFVSVLHIKIDMAVIDIHWKFLFNGSCLKSSNCNQLKTVSWNLFCVNAISIVFEIAGMTVKMLCKMTFVNKYRFRIILKSYFLWKTQQSLFSTCFFEPRYAWMNTKFTAL